jgi:hypothetical protein
MLELLVQDKVLAHLDFVLVGDLLH